MCFRCVKCLIDSLKGGVWKEKEKTNNKGKLLLFF